MLNGKDTKLTDSTLKPFCTVHHDFVLVITQILGGAGVPIMFKTVPERSTHYYVMVKSSDIDRANKALEGRGKFI